MGGGGTHGSQEQKIPLTSAIATNELAPQSKGISQSVVYCLCVSESVMLKLHISGGPGSLVCGGVTFGIVSLSPTWGAEIT